MLLVVEYIKLELQHRIKSFELFFVEGEIKSSGGFRSVRNPIHLLQCLTASCEQKALL